MNTAAVAAFARLGELNDYPALLAELDKCQGGSGLAMRSRLAW